MSQFKKKVLFVMKNTTKRRAKARLKWWARVRTPLAKAKRLSIFLRLFIFKATKNIMPMEGRTTTVARITPTKKDLH